MINWSLIEIILIFISDKGLKIFYLTFFFFLFFLRDI